MMRRPLILAFVLALAQPASAQVLTNAPEERDINVRVVDQYERPLEQIVRVQLVPTSGGSITENVARDGMTTLRARLMPGYYAIQVTGDDIEPARVDFVIRPRQSFIHITIRTEPRVKPHAAQTSMQGSISAAELNIPPRAAKEFEKGKKALLKDRLDEARDHFQRSVEIYPQYAMAYNNLGVIAMRTGDMEGGKQFFVKAVELDPKLPNASLNLAKVSSEGGQFAEVERLTNNVLSSDPNNVEAMVLLANALFMQSRFEPALTMIRKVHGLEHKPFTMAHLISAAILERLNRPAEAAAEYKVYLAEGGGESETRLRVQKRAAALEDLARGRSN